MPKMSDHDDPGLRGSQGFSGGWAIHVPGVCWLLRDHLFDGKNFSGQARLATRIGFYGLLQGSNGCHWFRFFSLSPAYIFHEPNDFDAFKGVFGRCLTLGVGLKGVFPRKVSVWKGAS